MSVQLEIPGNAALAAIAEDSGLAVTVVDSRGNEIAAFNNNSICQNLNPGGKLVKQCSAYCGLALAESNEVGGQARFTCHAGLECRALAMVLDGKPAAVIVGRAFVRADEYRKATQRAIDGDWQTLDAAELFSNVLLAGTPGSFRKTMELIEAEATVIETAEDNDSELVEPVEDIIAAAAETASAVVAAEIGRIAEQVNLDTARTHAAEPADDGETGFADIAPAVDVATLQIFFSTVLNKDYVAACESFLTLAAENYSLDSLVWLERRERRLVRVAASAGMKTRRLNLGIFADDVRLASAAKTEYPVVLTEHAATPAATPRTMLLFPVPVGTDIPAVLAVLDTIGNDAVIRQIARLCQTIGPQLEILRLRSEAARREANARAVRRFSDDLKNVDSDDFWLQMTQKIATELMDAERGSLLVLNEKTGVLEIKAAIGIRNDISHDPAPGTRVAKLILERGIPTVVTDVMKTKLPPMAADRGYKTGSFLSSPISLGGRNIAVINFTDKSNGAAFGRDDLELLEEITPQIAVAIDRAMLKEKVGTFAQLSVTDSLTGLLNRRYIEERLIEEVKRSSRHGYPMCFIMLDVDNFKSYNDNFGHPAGDEALRIVGHVLRDTLRGADVAARYGGEEFAILLPQTTADEAAVIAERLRSNVESTAFPCRRVTVSIGVSSCTSEQCEITELIESADKALYQAKRAGRNLVRLASDAEANEI